MTNMEVLQGYYSENFDTWVKRIDRRVDCIMDAEDVVQEAYLRALTFIDSYDSTRSSIQTWFTLLINQTYAKMRQREFNSCEIREDDVFTPNADEYEGDEQIYELVMKEIDKESDAEKRQALWLYFGCSIPVREIEKLTSLGYHNVRTTIARFKKDLRERYNV